MKKIFSMLLALATCTVAFSQAAYIQPSPTGKNDTITLYINVAQTTDGTMNNALSAMLTDLQMPHMNGQALVRVVVKMIPDLPIIAMSGNFTAQDERDLSALGVRARLEKPFDEARLITVLRKIFPGGFQPLAPAISTSPNQTPPDYGQNTDT